MMQINEVQQRFSRIEQTIHQAAEVCESTAHVPMDLKDSVQQLEQKSNQAKGILQQAGDDESVRQCVDELEQLGDQARDACEQAPMVDEKLKSMVMQAHRELSDLKHQLH